MKFTLSWLKEHLDFHEEPDMDALVEAMTMAGLEVESVEDPRAKLAAFTVAKVIAAEPHPNADKLRVCRVDTKDGEKQIVCGAPNARTGLVGIYAPLGVYIPGLDLTLDKKPRAIRGVESHGMLCSSKELETGDDHDGIVDLQGDWTVGDPAADALGVGDPVIDFEVTPNRPDWLGVRGIARDLAAAGLGTFKDAPAHAFKTEGECPVAVKVRDKAFCPSFGLRLVRGVKNGPSPEWMQKQLRAIGLRPINALVDVTNFVTYDCARPLHVFDAAKVKGDLVVRPAKKGESLLALDGKTYELDETVGVIADDAGVESLAGVMGGEASGCTEETTDVLIEAALWDPIAIARTGRKLGITSDAQYRFARGVDPASVEEGLDLATALVLEMCGGKATEASIVGKPSIKGAKVSFRPEQVKRLTGLEVSDDDCRTILTDLGFAVAARKSKGAITVTAPSWRGDVEGEADLVEEIARIVGYDKLPEVSLRAPDGRKPVAIGLSRKRAGDARRTLAARGLLEAITWSFCRSDQAKLFGGADGLELANPITADLDVMRPSPLPHLLTALQKNADRGWFGGALFEVGPVYRGVEPDDQESVAAGARAVRNHRHWTGDRAADVFDVKADVLAALAAAGAPADKLQIAEASPWWHPGRSGRLQLGPKMILGEFGEVHPGVLRALDVDGPIVAFEAYLDRVPAPRAKPGKAKPALEEAELMPVRRDFAFVVDEDVRAGDLVRAVQGADKALVVGVDVFDVFVGDAIGAGKKSIAVEVTLQPREATLDDAALENVSKLIVAAVVKAT
ncbi:MAG: phenylalanine--tRNA ligase subunit beta, partial [Maricaulaceae bacterium]